MFYIMWAATICSFIGSFSSGASYITFAILCIIQLVGLDSYCTFNYQDKDAKKSKPRILRFLFPPEGFVKLMKKASGEDDDSCIPVILALMSMALFVSAFAIGALYARAMPDSLYTMEGAINFTYNIYGTCLVAMLASIILITIIGYGEDGYKRSALSRTSTLYCSCFMFTNLYVLKGSFVDLLVPLMFFSLIALSTHKMIEESQDKTKSLKRDGLTLLLTAVFIPLSAFMTGNEIVNTHNGRLESHRIAHFDNSTLSVKWESPLLESDLALIEKAKSQNVRDLDVTESILANYRLMHTKPTYMRAMIFGALYVPSEEGHYVRSLDLYQETAEIVDKLLSHESVMEALESDNPDYANSIEILKDSKSSWSKGRESSFKLIELAKQEKFEEFWKLYFDESEHTVIQFAVAKATYMHKKGIEFINDDQLIKFKGYKLEDYTHNKLVFEAIFSQ
ncbi:hypothetical protein [Vibrio owensii]|uniref:hypothetical protein n=1 Tax=Vibrio owensii TaxID=696485 RepID=UPI003CC5E361